MAGFLLIFAEKLTTMKILRKWSWVAIAALALAGCAVRTNPYHPQGGNEGNGNSHGNNGNDPAPAIQVTERTDWKISYLGRADYTEQDGTVSRVEELSFKYTGDGYFIVRTLTPEDLVNLYDNDLQSMLEGEVSDVVTQAENEDRKFYENTNSVFNNRTQTVYFDLIIHGDYTAYMIEIGQDGKPTYHYAKTAMHVEEERPVEGFLQWIGRWHVTDGYVGYDIVVSSCEANYLYYVDGWETGSAVQEQMTMDRDWIFARYRNRDANLYFYGQYLMSYEDEGLQDTQGNNVWVDQMFVGTYLTNNSDKNGEVDGEGAYAGFDIAHTVRMTDGKVVLEPEQFKFDNGFNAVYHSMRYSRFCYDEQNWAHYNNSGVPTFTGHVVSMVQMVPVGATETKAPMEHRRTKEVVRRTQPQAHVDKTLRSR